MSTHTAVATTSLGKIDAIQIPTRTPGEGDILIKTSAAAISLFDTYPVDRGFLINAYPLILGFNGAGTVVKVGTGVHDFKVGDRVVAITMDPVQGKSSQEYITVSRTLCAKIPDSLSFPEAATIPDNFVTAFYVLFSQLGLPIPPSFPAPTVPSDSNTPMLVYGAGSTVGQYVIQLLQLAGYTNVIATASAKHHANLRSLGATHTFDYNSPSLVEDVTKAAGGKVTVAIDCVSVKESLAILGKIVSAPGKVAFLLPIKEGSTITGNVEEKLYMNLPDDINPFPKDIKVFEIKTFLYQQDEVLREKLMPKFLSELLEAGLIKPNKVRLFDHGSIKERVEAALDQLRHNTIKGEKAVVVFEM
ncbi:hypothetical protein K443DRAFT_96876 [Laccaria amethystina LaAM-08-1]|uniref:Enoyl reductase (ER) domain-containing protein n=1 Tax=Laccaria amethystina LaAM-08-1 TaxID=1095629 RepID=A0A0C9WTR9_9AGAR|nr:hypothetical protein K443DRAFT_96876 [Laccaria amethystina LaAM-08-1]